MSQGPDGYMLSHEAVGGSEGWIMGKAPRAFYAFQTKDKLAPATDWSIQVLLAYLLTYLLTYLFTTTN